MHALNFRSGASPWFGTSRFAEGVRTFRLANRHRHSGCQRADSGRQIEEPGIRRRTALTGELRAIRGALAMTFKAHGDKRAFVLPAPSATEAALVADASVYPVKNLLQVCAFLAGKESLQTLDTRTTATSGAPQYADFSEVKGQATPNARWKLPPQAGTAR